MPVYEYQCPACKTEFSHLWRSMADASDGEAPACPECGKREASRVISAPTVLGKLGGLTPSERSEVRQAEDRLASITPKSQIDQLQASRSQSGKS